MSSQTLSQDLPTAGFHNLQLQVGHSKVGNTDVPLWIQQQILRLQIPMTVVERETVKQSWVPCHNKCHTGNTLVLEVHVIHFPIATWNQCSCICLWYIIKIIAYQRDTGCLHWTQCLPEKAHFILLLVMGSGRSKLLWTRVGVPGVYVICYGAGWESPGSTIRFGPRWESPEVVDPNCYGPGWESLGSIPFAMDPDGSPQDLV